MSCGGRGNKPMNEDNLPYGLPVVTVVNGTISCPTDNTTADSADIKLSDVSLPITANNNNNNNDHVKPNGNGSLHHRPSWKFWQRLSMRRPNRKSPLAVSKARSQSTNDVDGNLPDVVTDDSSGLKRTSSLKPPPKPPRLFLFRSSSINTPRSSVVIESNRNSFVLSQAYQTGSGDRNSKQAIEVSKKHSTETAQPHELQKAEENISVEQDLINKLTESLSSKYNSLPVQKSQSFNQTGVSGDKSVVWRQKKNSSTGKIKIVSPELNRKVRARRKCSDITAQDRHVLIMQSATELLCQKIDPFIIIEDLTEAGLLGKEDLLAFRGHPDSRIICETIVQSIIDRDYQSFIKFCDLLRSKTDLTTVAAVLEAMKSVYDIIYEVPANEGGNRSPIVEDEKNISFDVVYYSLETGKIRSVVELEKSRNTDNKRHSRDVLSFKRNSRLSFHSLTSEASSIFNEDMISTGLPMVTVAIAGHDLSREKARALAKVIENNSCILELHVGKTHIKGPDMEHISNALVNCWGLNVLDLRLNNICNEGAVYMANVLLHNKCLRQLNLSSTGMDSEGCKILAEALRTNTTLVDLDLSFVDVGDGGCLALSDTLKQNRSLKKLRLRSANISWIGCGFLMAGLEIGKTVTDLDLSRNFIGDKGAEMLLSHMKDDSSLKELILENCGFTTTGSVILSDIILTNKSLKHLDLSVNFIGDQGISKLSNALERNKHIKTLGLNMCGISNDGFAKLLDILESNTTVTLLKMCFNRLGREHTNPEATSDNLKYRIRIVTSSNPKLKLLLWGNTFDESPPAVSIGEKPAL